MNPITIRKPDCPLILAMPHSGTFVPPDMFSRLNDIGQLLADTDWYIDKLYDGLVPQAGMVKANFHRYVIDANRDPADVSLYPGQNNTSLCPTTNFEGISIWQAGCEPDDAEIAKRIAQFHAPYHQALQDMIYEIKQQFGYAILYDCHSIRSELPYLFEGTLPTLNIGTFNGASCALNIEQAVTEICAESDYSHVLNGRFKGGWTTRHYGKPKESVHAIQMEIAQGAYMQECAPWRYVDEKADILRGVLKDVLLSLKAITL